MMHSSFPATDACAWDREAACLRDMARQSRNADVAASLLRQADAADRQAAWHRSEVARCAREDAEYRAKIERIA